MTTSKQRSSIKATLLTVTGALLLSTLTTTPVFAKACKSVYIEAKNQTGNKIKIVDLDYWDVESEKWRSEPTKNESINNGRVWQTTRNLERVNNQDVKIRIEYKKAKWNKLLKKWTWKAKKSKFVSTTKKCSRGVGFVMTIR